MATVESYANLARRILARPAPPSRLVAVDGPGGAGKSLFATRLAAALSDAPIVQTDDFASWDNPIDWWSRLESGVIEPLLDGHAARYRRYDWERRKLADWREVQPAPAVIIEGVSSARRAVANLLTLAIWVHAPRQTRLARGLDRDGPASRSNWEQWMAEEDEHFGRDGTIERCEVVVDGAPAVPHDPECEFIRLASCMYD